MLKDEFPKPGDVVEIQGSVPTKIGVVVSESRKMFMVGETVLVLADGCVERYLKEKLKVIKSG